jgi:hypothetical protein
VTCLVITKELVSRDTKSKIVMCLAVTKELVSRDAKSTVMMCLIVTKELVSRDTKSTVVSVVTCASSWVGEKQAFRFSLLAGHTDQEGAAEQLTECS